MDYQKIICKKTDKVLKADEVYKVRNNQDCIENIVSICKNCPYSFSKNHSCQNCYGTIVQDSVRKINEETNRIKITTTNYRNEFTKIGDDIMDIMVADDFIDNMDIIANLNNSSWNNGQRIADRLIAYDSPSTAKTDCKKCKKRYHDRGELTACEKAKKFCESKDINIKKVSDIQLQNLILPNECICQEQLQQKIYV